MTLTAAADGSSLGNPGPAGWAWYVDDDCWAAGGWESSTNNRGELTAVLELLRATEAAGLAGEELLIQCDSQYVINSLTKWRHGWKKRGWRKADGKPVLNADLVKDLDAWDKFYDDSNMEDIINLVMAYAGEAAGAKN